jgi:hypothetical protein
LIAQLTFASKCLLLKILTLDIRSKSRLTFCLVFKELLFQNPVSFEATL